MIEVLNLTKKFGELVAVDSVSFQVGRGEVLGFLGPNGAGKSTTMKMITGFIQPSQGDSKVCGYSVKEDRLNAQRCMGYVPENAPLYGDMYVREFLLFIAGMREVPPPHLHESVDQMLTVCALEEVEFQKIETLSKGYKRRLSLAQALLHDPDVLILDEPTDGLDPNQKHAVRTLIQQLSQDKCILVSTHILEEVEEICTRCVIIGQGRKLFSGTPKELKDKSDRGRLQDVFRAMTRGDQVEGVTL